MAELERLALLDELTRLPNRRHLLAELGAQLLLHRASSAPVGVLFIDIDHFKRFNDDHGHETGDLALQTVARTLKAGIRPFDVVGRWGGEEFVAIFPNVMPAGLAAAAERLQMLVRASRVETIPDPLSVRVSIGGAMARVDDSATTVLSRADAALYISKAAGRDRVTLDTADCRTTETVGETER
jgi:diguanylate cyclase (GGDEF)-like protein